MGNSRMERVITNIGLVLFWAIWGFGFYGTAVKAGWTQVLSSLSPWK
jgi:hypothetical protein